MCDVLPVDVDGVLYFELVDPLVLPVDGLTLFDDIPLELLEVLEVLVEGLTLFDEKPLELLVLLELLLVLLELLVLA